MEIAILEPMTIPMKRGPQDFKTGEIINLPDNLGRELLEGHPQKVRLISKEPLCVGMRVSYRYPTDIEGPTDYRWEPAIGEIEAIDHEQHLALIIPEHKPKAWLWVSLTYVKGLLS